MKAQVWAVNVGSGLGSAPICARHGQPASVRRRVTFCSRPPVWSYLLLLMGVLLFLIVVLVTRKSVTAPAWAFCDGCRALRSKLLAGGLGLLGGCLLTGVLAVSMSVPDEGADPSGVVLLLAFVLLLIGLVLLGRAGWATIAGGVASGDGQRVEFAKASAGFEQWTRQLTVTGPQWYGQQPYGYQPQQPYGYQPQQPYGYQPQQPYGW